MRFNKFFFIKLLLLTLFSLKVFTVLVEKIAENPSQEIVKFSLDESEKETEKEQKNDEIQRINLKLNYHYTSLHSKKVLFFKNTLSIKILSLEFITPPPEKLL